MSTGTVEGPPLKVSVVTVCYNSADTIGKTMDSVAAQTYPDMEYVVVDGKSTDGTDRTIADHRDRISVLISERDEGIYDAMNKGVEASSGDLIYFLNSGDLFCGPDTVGKIVEVFRGEPACDLVEGDLFFYHGDSQEYRSLERQSMIGLVARGVYHQALFARRTAFDRAGLFDTRFRIYADLDWFLRCVVSCEMKVLHISMPVAYYLAGGASQRHRERRFFEKGEIYRRYASLGRLLSYGTEQPDAAFVLLLMRFYYMLGRLRYAGHGP